MLVARLASQGIALLRRPVELGFASLRRRLNIREYRHMLRISRPGRLPRSFDTTMIQNHEIINSVGSHGVFESRYAILIAN